MRQQKEKPFEVADGGRVSAGNHSTVVTHDRSPSRKFVENAFSSNIVHNYVRKTPKQNEKDITNPLAAVLAMTSVLWNVIIIVYYFYFNIFLHYRQ